jgi:predicted transcriptional regulator
MDLVDRMETIGHCNILAKDTSKLVEMQCTWMDSVDCN